MVVAVFVSAAFFEVGKLRLWAQRLDKRSFVLLTDTPTEGNSVLVRQLRCSNVICAHVHLAGIPRNLAEIQAAQLQRDRLMMSVAENIFVFGDPLALPLHEFDRGKITLLS